MENQVYEAVCIIILKVLPIKKKQTNRTRKSGGTINYLFMIKSKKGL